VAQSLARLGAAEPTLEPEEEEQTRKQREEKELIMDRILEEERAQEDADERVAALKARLVAVKAKRVAAKAKAQELKNGKS
jgi:zinc finger protein 830